MTLTIFKEREHGLHHEVYEGAPCEWSRDRGATHTLWCGAGHGRGTRPARLLKTRLLVGVDELPGDQIQWETWAGRVYMTDDQARRPF